MNKVAEKAAKIILAAIVLILFSTVLGVAGYLVKNPKVKSVVYQPTPTPEVTPTVQVKDRTTEFAETLSIPSEIIRDIANNNDACQDKNNITEADYNIDSRVVDLNNDNVGEIIINAYNICALSLFGATSDNHPVYIYQKINGAWINIFEDGGSGVDILDTKTEGYNDISVGGLLNAALIITSKTIYSWNNSKLSYEEISTVIESEIDANRKDNTIDNWNSYTNYKYNFEIKYPNGWKVDADGKTSESNSVASFIFQTEGINSKGKIIVGVYTLPNKRFIEYAGVVAGTNNNYQFVISGLDFAENKEMNAVLNQMISTFKFTEK